MHGKDVVRGCRQTPQGAGAAFILLYLFVMETITGQVDTAPLNSSPKDSSSDSAADAAVAGNQSADRSLPFTGSFRRVSGAKQRVAIVTMGVKLGDETRGYTRFRYLANLLVEQGFAVDLITSGFQHWEKEQRDTSRSCYKNLPYTIVFIDEPGYTKNLDLSRIKSHKVAAGNLRNYFAQQSGVYSLIYAEIPPNDVALACAQSAKQQGIPFIADINDLWPEAMRMAVDIPVISSVAFYPFSRDARKVYNLMDAAVGTSDEYALQPMKYRDSSYPHITVYVGNDLSEFDEGAAKYAAEIDKPDTQLWLTYAGTLGASYDIGTLVRAAAIAGRKHPQLRVKVLGDGPNRSEWEQLAKKLDAPVDFEGYQDYAHMAAYLAKSDITINSLIKTAPQSIVTKIGDYLSSGSPMINTGSSQEMRLLVSDEGIGINVPAEDDRALADAINRLLESSSLRKIMGSKARALAEKRFNQPHSYLDIVNFIRTFI